MAWRDCLSDRPPVFWPETLAAVSAAVDLLEMRFGKVEGEAGGAGYGLREIWSSWAERDGLPLGGMRFAAEYLAGRCDAFPAYYVFCNAVRDFGWKSQASA